VATSVAYTALLTVRQDTVLFLAGLLNSMSNTDGPPERTITNAAEVPPLLTWLSGAPIAPGFLTAAVRFATWGVRSDYPGGDKLPDLAAGGL
jgi:hypothetical protein